MQVRVFPSKFLFVGCNGLLLAEVGADVIRDSVPVDVGAPGFVLWIEPNALDAGLAVPPDPVVSPGFFLRHDLQVLVAAVQPVVVQEDRLKAFGRWQNLSVQVAQAVLTIDLSVTNSVALPAVTFGPVAPLVVVEKLEIGVINKSNLTLGKWNLTHGRVTSVL